MAGLLLDEGPQTQGGDLGDGNRESDEVLSVLADPVIHGVLSDASSGYGVIRVRWDTGKRTAIGFEIMPRCGSRSRKKPHLPTDRKS